MVPFFLSVKCIFCFKDIFQKSFLDAIVHRLEKFLKEKTETGLLTLCLTISFLLGIQSVLLQIYDVGKYVCASAYEGRTKISLLISLRILQHTTISNLQIFG